MKLHSVENGFCRVYYRGSMTRLFCYQAGRGGQFEMFICTKDGEPSYQITNMPVSRSQLPPPDTSTARGLIAWLEKEGLIHEDDD